MGAEMMRETKVGRTTRLARTRIGVVLHLAIIVAVFLGASLLQAQEKRPVETEDMFAMRNVGSPVVSPDGEWIAYTVSRTSLEDERSYTRLFMVSARGGDPLPLTADKKSAGSPAWDPSGRYITFTSTRDGGKTQVWALDRRGGEAQALTHVEQGVSGYRFSPDGGRLLLTIRDPKPDSSEVGKKKENAPEDPWVIDRLQFKRDNVGYLTGDRHTHLYVYDLETEELRQLTDGRWDESLGVWSPDGTRIAFTSNRTEEPDGNGNSDIWTVPADLTEPTDSPHRVTTNPGADGSPVWSPNGELIAYTTGIRPDLIWYATTHLAVISADGGEPRLLTTELDRNVRSPRYSADGGWIWFGLEDSGENHVARIRPDGNGLQRMIAGPLSASGFDWAAGTFAVRVSDLDHPAEIFTVDAIDDGDGRPLAVDIPGPDDLKRVTSHNDDFLSRILIPETKDVVFPSADGTEIEGFVTFPPDFQEGLRYPTLLRIHGGPVSQFSNSFNFESQLFAANGYVVVRTNPRGSSGYGQEFSAALWADWGGPDFEDVMAGIDYAVEQGWADSTRLGVGGWSYGGILTDHVITQTDRFKGAISGASEVLYIANYGHDHYQRQWEAELGLPWEGDNRDNWERISAFNKVEKITTPTLVMGGEKDWNVPIQNGEQLYQALRRRGVPTQLVVYPGQGHGIRVPSYQVDRYRRYLAWYDRWVKGTGSPES
jgi:dipeptidyl aminopeptidase/acylaminoacyl peptidase